MKNLVTFVTASILPSILWAADQTPAIDYNALTDRMLAALEHQFGKFQDETASLFDAATAYCETSADRTLIEDAFADAWRAWAPLDAYQFGPIETQAAALTVNFFPDKKNFVGRAVTDLLKRPEGEQAIPAVIAASSAGTQGLPALERLLFDDVQTCPALVGVAGNLAQIGHALYDGWFAPDGWADLVRHAGPDNPVYLSHQEFTRQIITALDFSILRLREHRIGRALGTYDRSFPTRAEAWRSGITNDIMIAQIDGLIEVVDSGFADTIPDATRAKVTQSARDIQTRIQAIGAPLSEAFDDPQMRIRVEALQTKLDYLKLQLDQEIGEFLGIDAGFSAGDGD
ncbi:imelysin family protein [Aliiroseovarius sp. F47248L]|uniref:imelysin family protein n=1 Tax=Aliiroseovarius sp. F47248L TaxID=2926420 RepID=UPI001FF25C1C|nr:imelysin family protein [Aliiroseovarius sp. F47248L]MCK0137684.1 imelysin family protein [Aliiroseovarius sp. F47248L]